VVAYGVALLDHAAGELRVGIDVLLGHEERCRDLEIGQDLQHPFGVRVHGSIVEREICTYRLVSLSGAYTETLSTDSRRSGAIDRMPLLGRALLPARYCGTRRTCPANIKSGSLIWLRFASNMLFHRSGPP
jgi:hypothetical protein